MIMNKLKSLLPARQYNRVDMIMKGIIPDKSISLNKLAEWLEEYTNVDFALIKGSGRMQDIVRARHVFMWVAWVYCEDSLKTIGRFTSRDHSSVMNGRNQVINAKKTDYDTNPELRELANNFEIFFIFKVNEKEGCDFQIGE